MFLSCDADYSDLFHVQFSIVVWILTFSFSFRWSVRDQIFLPLSVKLQNWSASAHSSAWVKMLTQMFHIMMFILYPGLNYFHLISPHLNKTPNPGVLVMSRELDSQITTHMINTWMKARYGVVVDFYCMWLQCMLV